MPSISVHNASNILMARPAILVAEHEPAQALSVRKLVLETAKYNVLTAHSTREALDIFFMFPNVSIIVLVKDAAIEVDAIAKAIKEATTKIPIIVLSPVPGHKSVCADHNLSSYEPEQLLSLIRSLAGDPREMPPK